MKNVFIDIEADGLDPSKVWVAVTYEEEDGLKVWTRPDQDRSLSEYLAGNMLIGHNILGFDLPVLRRLCSVSNTWGSCIDTLVVSRLRNSWAYNEHSLDAWGKRLGLFKGTFNDWSKLSDEMIEYCKQDVRVTYKLYKKFEKFIQTDRWRKSLSLEHWSAQDCVEMSQNGFLWDFNKASSMRTELEERIEVLNLEMQRDFPPKVIEEEFIPKRDNKTRGYIAGVPVIKTSEKPFNPKSSKDRIERLWEAGWKPVDKTKGASSNKDSDKREHFDYYGWKTNEKNLGTLPADAPAGAKKLVEYLVLSSRLSTLTEWFNAYNPKTGRVHGNFNHIGAWTHRKSHSGPNMANIPSIAYLPKEGEATEVQKINARYNGAMRELWKVPSGRTLVGVDAEGIQLRVLAHYINNPEYTQAIVAGVKEDETDIHNVNKRALGLKHITRDHAKTFIYAFLLGAGAAKIGEILSVSPQEGRQAMDRFMEAIDGLAKLKRHTIPALAERGYFLGFDGRYVACDSEHLMLAGMLQNGESVVMKWADRIWKRELRKQRIPFWKVNDVHDEWQVETLPQYAEQVKETMINSIVQAGVELEVRCPLAGSGVIGQNWMETH